jgi:hypothetical protein
MVTMSIGLPSFSSAASASQPPQQPAAVGLPAAELKRPPIATGSRNVIADSPAQITEAARKTSAPRARGPLYEDLGNRLASLAASLTQPHALVSGALNLGKGNATPGVDPNRPLNTQSFGLPVTAGTVNVSFQVNGGATTTRSVTIDPGQSLNANLQQFSALTVGTKQPLKAEFTDGQAKFQATSTEGAAFKFSLSAGTSNFVEAVTNSSRAIDLTVTANAAVNSTPGTAFANLNVSINGVSTTLQNLETNASGLSPFQRATQLVSQINDGLAQHGVAQTGVQAVAQSNGTIQLVAHDDRPSSAAGHQVSVTESGPGRSLGFSGGFTAQNTLSGSPDLTGPDASLARLSGALGLNALNGGFSGTINGVKLNFDQGQSLSSALKDISASAAGVNAAYDPTTRKVTLTQQSASPAPIDVQDSAGNLFTALKLAPTTGTTPAAGAQGALDALKGAAQSLNDFIGLTDAAHAKGGRFAGTPLLGDLSAAAGAQFKLSNDGHLHTLADLGFSRQGGQVTVDAARQQNLIAHHADEVVAAVGAIASQQIVPLARSGQQALDDDRARTPANQRRAQQNVHARAEISRLQDRQNSLVHQSAAIDGARQNVQAQRSELEKELQRLQGHHLRATPDHMDLLKPVDRPGQQVPFTPLWNETPLIPTSITPPPLARAPSDPNTPPAGLLSFGLGARNP